MYSYPTGHSGASNPLV